MAMSCLPVSFGLLTIFCTLCCHAVGPFSSPSDLEREQAERDIVVRLERARDNLQIVAASSTSSQDFKAEVLLTVGILSRMETYLVQDDYSSAISELSNALSAMNSLERSSVHQAVLSLIRLAKGHAQEAGSYLNLLLQKDKLKGNYNPPVVVTDVESSQPCQIDGTICQYSNCGEGKRLPTCAVGFAAGVTGGANGESYVVTSSEDDPASPQPGTLRYGVSKGSLDTPIWITFAGDMTIILHDMLWVHSSTTIDGRGANVSITGRNLVLGGVNNVILHNLHISSVGETDTIHIFSGCKKVWVDHVSSWDARLGLVTVMQGSTDVTISNSFLSNPNFNMLLGASDADAEDKVMRVTVYRNWFKDSMQRMPHCRWGFCHVVNNLYTNWGYYAIGGRVHAKVVTESNVFVAGRRTEATPWYEARGPEFDISASIQSSNDLFLNGTTFHQFQGLPDSATMTTTQLSAAGADYTPPIHATSTLPLFIQKCSGALVGKKLEECRLVASSF